MLGPVEGDTCVQTYSCHPPLSTLSDAIKTKNTSERKDVTPPTPSHILTVCEIHSVREYSAFRTHFLFPCQHEKTHFFAISWALRTCPSGLLYQVDAIAQHFTSCRKPVILFSPKCVRLIMHGITHIGNTHARGKPY